MDSENTRPIPTNFCMEVCTYPSQVLGPRKIGVPTNFLEILTIFAFKQYINPTKYWKDPRKILNALFPVPQTLQW